MDIYLNIVTATAWHVKAFNHKQSPIKKWMGFYPSVSIDAIKGGDTS